MSRPQLERSIGGLIPIPLSRGDAKNILSPRVVSEEALELEKGVNRQSESKRRQAPQMSFRDLVAEESTRQCANYEIAIVSSDEEEGSDEWEDANSDDGQALPEPPLSEPTLFRRVESLPGLASRRSLLTQALTQASKGTSQVHSLPRRPSSRPPSSTVGFMATLPKPVTDSAASSPGTIRQYLMSQTNRRYVGLLSRGNKNEDGENLHHPRFINKGLSLDRCGSTSSLSRSERSHDTDIKREELLWNVEATTKKEIHRF